METINFEQVTSELGKQLNENLYVNLIDDGLDPATAYEEAFNSDFDLEADGLENPFVYGE